MVRIDDDTLYVVVAAERCTKVYDIEFGGVCKWVQRLCDQDDATWRAISAGSLPWFTIAARLI
jgi:predicted alpha-1,6-mannanase (GH76 family)